jgi:hypothetical protein
MSNITHVIQARITLAQGTPQRCAMCKKSKSKYVCTWYEVSNDGIELAYKAMASKLRTEEEVEILARQTPLNDLIYELTLREQMAGLPQEHAHDYDCYHCLADFIASGTNIPNYGAMVLSRLRAGRSIWIMRDVSATDRWAVIETPHQDVARLREELRNAVVWQVTRLKGEIGQI